jgi:biopolymer transport protein ExbD
VAGIKPYLEQEARVIREAGRDPATAKVIIRGDKDVPTGEVQDLIKACQEMTFTNFVLRAEYDERSPR